MKSNLNFEKLFIDGEWVSSHSPQWIQVENPATGEVFARVPAGDGEDVDRAVDAAYEAFLGWWNTPVEKRKAYLQKALDLMYERMDEIARLEMLELGAPAGWAMMAHAKGPLKRYEHFLKAIDDFPFQEEMGRSKVVKEPVGVVACLTPWNYPLEQIHQKVVPAMLTGNTVVLKPSQVTPLSAYILCQALREAGLPNGVFNLVTGRGGEVGNFMCTHPKVDMVSFTGSTSGGKEVGKLALDSVKKITLELGGKSALVVLKGGDLEGAVQTALASTFNNTGQTCSALTRLIVPRENLSEIEEMAVKHYDHYKVGDPRDPETNVGPLAGKKQFARVKGYIEEGIREGARMLLGAVPEEGGPGYFVRPVVFTDVEGDMTIAQEEIFGPVLSIIPYDHTEEAIDLANGTIYGLDGAVFGPAEEAAQVAGRMRTGRVYINGGRWDPNGPFGGYKQSGLGRESGIYGLAEYVEVKSVFDRDQKF
ncbi:MAG: aldehyde dehydrogenase family protein [Anaerovoracaceae bacterium]|jgi:aldehyde dehydrogenase (NAD+)